MNLQDIDFNTGLRIDESDTVLQFLEYLLSSKNEGAWFFRPDFYIDIEQYLFTLTDEASADIIADYIFDDVMRAIDSKFPQVTIDMSKSSVKIQVINGKLSYIIRFIIITKAGKVADFNHTLDVKEYMKG